MMNLSNEDCMDLMKRYPDKYFELAIVDPPYGIGEDGSRNKADRPTEKWKNPNSKIYKVFDDSGIPQQDYWEELFRVSKNQIVWGGNNFTEFLPKSTGWIVWNKKVDPKEYLSMAELAYSSFQKRCMMFNFLWAGFKKGEPEERIHPTQKPVALYKWLLKNYAKEGDKILDTHLGSMSIAIAIHQINTELNMNLTLTGCELDEEYFKAGMERVNNQTKQHSLFSCG